MTRTRVSLTHYCSRDAEENSSCAYKRVSTEDGGGGGGRDREYKRSRKNEMVFGTFLHSSLDSCDFLSLSTDSFFSSASTLPSPVSSFQPALSYSCASFRLHRIHSVALRCRIHLGAFDGRIKRFNGSERYISAAIERARYIGYPVFPPRTCLYAYAAVFVIVNSRSSVLLPVRHSICIDPAV